MKKSLLLLASMLVSAVSFAQWTAPKPSATQEMSSEPFQYLYNAEAGGFFAGANDWNTRASIANFGDSIYFSAAESGLGYNFNCRPSVKTGWLYVSCNNFDAMWVDAGNAAGNDSYPGTDCWVVEKQANGSYKIKNSADESGYLSIVQTVKGVSNDTRCYLYDPAATYTETVDGEEIEHPYFAGSVYDEWYFIDSVEYKALQPQVVVYRAACTVGGKLNDAKTSNPTYDWSVIEAAYGNTSQTTEDLEALSAKIDAVNAFKAAYDAAVEKYPTLDFSAPKAVYDNTASTTEELEAAKTQVQTIINDYMASLASFDDPSDFTEQIGDGSSVDPWTREFTGSGSNGSHTTNTWSTEAVDGADGTDMLTPFCEHWVASGGKLSDQKIYQKLSSLPAGLYKFTADVRAYSEAGGIDHFETLKMFFGNDTINLQEEADMYLSGSKCVLWTKDYFSVIAIVKEMGDVELGFDIKDANFNWVAFKNTSLTYYGNKDVEENAAKLIKMNYTFTDPEEIDANPELVAAYKTALDEFNNAVAVEDVKAAAKAANAAYAVVAANATAYDNLINTKIPAWEEACNRSDLGGNYWDDFTDFAGGAEVEGYPTPTIEAIKEGDRSMTTAEINTYIDTVDSLYSYAIANSMVEGSDCTDMLTNPSFADGFTGWTKADGKSTPTGNVGGLAICKDVEVYSNVVYVQQVVNDVPDGIYSLSCQAFERPAANGSFDGSEEAKVYLFMNDFQTPVMNICKDAVAEDAVRNKVNCYVAAEDDATTGGGSWPYDYDVAGYGWVPNSMDGASYAFAAGRYNQKVYGLISGGKMTIGLTSNGQTAHWVLWANFKLTYEGKNAEALAEILPTYTDQLTSYYEENADNMTAPMTNEIDKVLTQADDAIASGDGDQMYDALDALNSTYTAAKANVAATTDFLAALENAGAAYEISESESAKAEYDAIYAEVAEYSDFTTDKLISYTEKLNTVASKLKVPAEAGDWTSLITNPAFDEGTADGWTRSFAAITNIGYQSANYTNSEDGTTISQFIEGWRSGNAAIGDGAICQTIGYLPVGTYTLGVDAIANLQSISDDSWQEKVTGVYLYASQNGVVIDSVEIKTANGAPQHFTLDFAVATEGAVEIGIKTVSATANWLAADNWTLTCTSFDPSAIATVNATATSAAAGIYTVSGARISKVQKGINIVKMADGTVRKVMVK